MVDNVNGINTTLPEREEKNILIIIKNSYLFFFFHLFLFILLVPYFLFCVFIYRSSSFLFCLSNHQLFIFPSIPLQYHLFFTSSVFILPSSPSSHSFCTLTNSSLSLYFSASSFIHILHFHSSLFTLSYICSSSSSFSFSPLSYSSTSHRHSHSASTHSGSSLCSSLAAAALCTPR